MKQTNDREEFNKRFTHQGEGYEFNLLLDKEGSPDDVYAWHLNKQEELKKNIETIISEYQSKSFSESNSVKAANLGVNAIARIKEYLKSLK